MPEKLDYVTTLTPEILERAEKELGEDEHRRTESALAIREWAKNNLIYRQALRYVLRVPNNL